MPTIIRTAAFVTCLALGSAISGSSSAQSRLTCGEDYVVQPGDTLSRLAVRLYGDIGLFNFIYTANSDVIGPNPSLIEIGDVFFLPCLDSQVPSSAPEFREERGTERLPLPQSGNIRIITGTDWAPFTDEDQAQGGMLVEMTNVALTEASTKPGFKIDFINDWGAHLSPLLTDIAYDLSIAWYEPNCAVLDLLDEDSQFRCNNFDWSEPIYEQIMGYYIRASDPVPASYDEIRDRNVCRPAGFSLFFLEEQGLTANLSQPPRVVDCMIGLHDGRYDVVVLAPEVAEVALKEIGMTAQTTSVENLASVLPIGAVISKNHPRKDEILSTFNGAIRELKASGEWFQIVLRHLQEHRAKTQ